MRKELYEMMGEKKLIRQMLQTLEGEIEKIISKEEDQGKFKLIRRSIESLLLAIQSQINFFIKFHDNIEKIKRECQHIDKIAKPLIEQCPEPLKWIVGELLAYNKHHWIINPQNWDTYGYSEIMNNGFTTNQERWIKKLIDLINKKV